MPLYSTEPLDPNLMTRGVMNFEMTPSFFRGPAHTIDLRPGLANAQCPVLVLSGELDPVMPVELNREIVSSLPDGLGRFELFPGISHMQVGNGDDCERVIREFILAP
jgi:proline iminopeptidase